MTLINQLKRVLPDSLRQKLTQMRRNFNREVKSLNRLSPYLPEILCIDVGASYFPHSTWQLFLDAPHTYWIAVEPNKSNLGYLENWPYSCHVRACTTGLSRLGGRQRLYVTNIDSGSSLLEPKINESIAHRINSLDYYFPLKIVDIDTLTLTDVIESHSSTVPVLVKLDTQGSELDILHGAKSYLENHRIVGIEMESTLLAEPKYVGSGKFWEACRDLEELGFELLSINPFSFSSRYNKKNPKGRSSLNECDAIFTIKRNIAREMSVEYRMTLFAFYITNRFFEEALSLFENDNILKDTLSKRGANTDILKARLQENL